MFFVQDLLHIQDPHVLSSKLTEEDPQEVFGDALESPLSEMLIFHLK